MSRNPLLVGLQTGREAQSFVVVIFGVTGDLTRKKLIPALFSLYVKGYIGRFKIVGFARRPWSQESFTGEVASMLEGGDFSAYGPGVRNLFLSNLEYVQSTFEEEAGYTALKKACKGYANRLYYLSTPPESYLSIIANLGSSGLNRAEGGFTRIVVEKPFGRDLGTARELNLALSEHFAEDQVFRIDHYLGKETVQNIMLLRFGNSIFEPVWNSRYIHHVQITVAEKIGVGTRGNYYERSGALRDMVQNHIFQLLCLTAMEPPPSLSPDSIRTEKVKVLSSLRPITHKNFRDLSVRGQYGHGHVDGRLVPGYKEENGVPKDSRTETFVALKLYLDTWRWSGVPFYLRTGKRLSRRVSEIAVQFKEPPLRLFNPLRLSTNRNLLVLRIQPDEGTNITMNAKIPGYSTMVRPVNMDFAYGSAFGESPPEAYERLILDALLGDSTLYTRRDEIEASWTFITRILKGWENDPEPLPSYLPGSSGPEAARPLVEDAKWRKL